MNCYIKRYNEKIEKYSYFNKHLKDGFNHWVQKKEEAKLFDSVKEARWIIKHYKLKKCDIEYEGVKK